MIPDAPMPANEMERLLSLSALDLSYADLNSSFTDLARLAAGIAGTSISLVNLVDAYTQWSIASHGINLEQMPREDSVCQYTILEENHFEVINLAADDRFKDKDYVCGDPNLVYYFGVPLKTEDGQKIGALCVLDKNAKVLDPAKAELLKIIASEIVTRLQLKKIAEELNYKVIDMAETQHKLAHDIRGPIAGIIGLGKLFKNRVYDTAKEKLQEVFSMIENGGESVLSLAEDIMNGAKKKERNHKAGNEHEYNLAMFSEAIKKLYLPMAKSKNIQFEVVIDPGAENVYFPKKMLMQITGNLVSNAMKFTAAGGKVTVVLGIDVNCPENVLRISIQDSGVGMTKQMIHDIMNGTAVSTNGTLGENGFGFGLGLVKRLVESLNGTLEIFSRISIGTQFDIVIPQNNNDLQMTVSDTGIKLVPFKT